MLKSLNKYGELNTYDLLKAAACIFMLIDHIGMFFLKDHTFLRVIGRSAYPIFAFCIGYNKNYQIRPLLPILAIFMAAFELFLDPEARSIIGALKSSIIPSVIIVKMCMMVLYSRLNGKFIGYTLIILMFSSLHSCLLFQYGFFGVLFAIFGFLSREGCIKEYITHVVITFFLYTMIEGYGVGYSTLDYISSSVIFSVLIYIFMSFYIMYVKIPDIGSMAIMILSRQSLMVYFIHYEIMYMVEHLLNK